MDISAKTVMQLRKETGAGLMDCKKALVETGGDFEAAKKVIRSKAEHKADKLSSRLVTEGRVDVATNGTRGVILHVGCNTDFVARNNEFADFVSTLTMLALEQAPADVDQLTALAWPSSENTVSEKVQEVAASTGENITIESYSILEVDRGLIDVYQHNNRRASLVWIKGPDNDLVRSILRELTLQVVGAAPDYLSRDDVDPEAYKEQENVFLKEVENKPLEMQGKIVQGKFDKWYKMNTLLEQELITRPDDHISAKEVLEAASKALGEDVMVEAFLHVTL